MRVKRTQPVLQKQDVEPGLPDESHNSSQDSLILNNKGMIYKALCGYFNSSKAYGIQMDDLNAVAMLAVFKASKTFDARKGSWFNHASGYIKAYVQNEFYKQLNISREEGRRRHKCHERVNVFESLSQELSSTEEGDQITLEDVIAHPEDQKVLAILEVNDLLARLQKANGMVHHLASVVIQMRFGIGSAQENPLSLNNVAAALGLSKEGVRKIEAKAMAYLVSISK